MMKLLPTLRSKKRYILFQIQAERIFFPGEIEEAANSALQLCLGQFGVARAAPLFVKEYCKDNQFVLKVSHRAVDEAKAALILIKKIKNVPVLLHSVRTSGTLKKAGSSA